MGIHQSLEVSLDSCLSLRCQCLQDLLSINPRLRNKLLGGRRDFVRNLSLYHFCLEGLHDMLEDYSCFSSNCWIRSTSYVSLNNFPLKYQLTG